MPGRADTQTRNANSQRLNVPLKTQLLPLQIRIAGMCVCLNDIAIAAGSPNSCDISQRGRASIPLVAFRLAPTAYSFSLKGTVLLRIRLCFLTSVGRRFVDSDQLIYSI